MWKKFMKIIYEKNGWTKYDKNGDKNVEKIQDKVYEKNVGKFFC